MINSYSVLEHIANKTESSLEDVSKIVKVEYWKDLVCFTNRSGPELFAKYLNAIGIRELQAVCCGYGIEISAQLFDSLATEKHIQIYIGGSYMHVFRRDHENEFKFPKKL